MYLMRLMKMKMMMIKVVNMVLIVVLVSMVMMMVLVGLVIQEGEKRRLEYLILRNELEVMKMELMMMMDEGDMEYWGERIIEEMYKSKGRLKK